MTVEQLIELLQKVGFPIFVAGWFMFRHEKRMDRQAELTRSLIRGVTLLAHAVDNRDGAHGRLSTQPPFLEELGELEGAEVSDTDRTGPPRIEDLK